MRHRLNLWIMLPTTVCLIIVGMAVVTHDDRCRLLSLRGMGHRFWIDSFVGCLFFTVGHGPERPVTFDSGAFDITGGILTERVGSNGSMTTVAIPYWFMAVTAVALPVLATAVREAPAHVRRRVFSLRFAVLWLPVVMMLLLWVMSYTSWCDWLLRLNDGDFVRFSRGELYVWTASMIVHIPYWWGAIGWAVCAGLIAAQQGGE